jgi:hypothetical protein
MGRRVLSRAAYVWGKKKYEKNNSCSNSSLPTHLSGNRREHPENSGEVTHSVLRDLKVRHSENKAGISVIFRCP